jgi:hypothetical protein
MSLPRLTTENNKCLTNLQWLMFCTVLHKRKTTVGFQKTADRVGPDTLFLLLHAI